MSEQDPLTCDSEVLPPSTSKPGAGATQRRSWNWLNKAAIGGLIFCLFAVVFLLIWAHRYHYERLRNSDGLEQILKINRFTGRVCYLQNDGTWSSERFSKPATSPLSQKDLAEAFFGQPDPCK
jgi:hypothetical protein